MPSKGKEMGKGDELKTLKILTVNPILLQYQVYC